MRENKESSIIPLLNKWPYNIIPIETLLEHLPNVIDVYSDVLWSRLVYTQYRHVYFRYVTWLILFYTSLNCLFKFIEPSRGQLKSCFHPDCLYKIQTESFWLTNLKLAAQLRYTTYIDMEFERSPPALVEFTSVQHRC